MEQLETPGTTQIYNQLIFDGWAYSIPCKKDSFFFLNAVGKTVSQHADVYNKIPILHLMQTPTLSGPGLDM